jgi:carboxypeptidase C (cathepsin A)
MQRSLQVSLATLALIGVAIGAPAEDKVAYLPEMETFLFNVYSGYLPVGDTSKNLHYMFAESQHDPANDPLMVWFNGGPGCSSMMGYVQEHGPWVIEDGEVMWHQNEWSWNNRANMLYIESPAGVGYSYCGDMTECKFTDTSSAEDALQAILYWYNEKFPEYQNHELYVSGESYGGIYVPYTTYAIHKYNKYYENDADVFKPNLKGFIVGDGVTNWNYDTTPAFIEMAFWHGLYDIDMYNEKNSLSCDFSNL